MGIEVGGGIVIGGGIVVSTGNLPDTFITTQADDPLITENGDNLITES